MAGSESVEAGEEVMAGSEAVEAGEEVMAGSESVEAGEEVMAGSESVEAGEEVTAGSESVEAGEEVMAGSESVEAGEEVMAGSMQETEQECVIDFDYGADFEYTPIIVGSPDSLFSTIEAYRRPILNINISEDCTDQKIEEVEFVCEGFHEKFRDVELFAEGCGQLERSIVPNFESISNCVLSPGTTGLSIGVSPWLYEVSFSVDPSSCDLEIQSLTLEDTLNGERSNYELNGFITSIQNRPSRLETNIDGVGLRDLFFGENDLISGDFKIEDPMNDLIVLNTSLIDGSANEADIESMEFFISEMGVNASYTLVIDERFTIIGEFDANSGNYRFDFAGIPTISVSTQRISRFRLVANVSNMQDFSLLEANLESINYKSSVHEENITYSSVPQETERFRRLSAILESSF